MRYRSPEELLKQALAETLMRKWKEFDDETRSLFIILYKLELVLFNIERRNKKDDQSLKFIDDTLSWYLPLRQKIYNLKPKEEASQNNDKRAKIERLNLQRYFENTSLPLLQKWLNDSTDELIQSLIVMRDEKVEKLKKEKEKLEVKYIKRAKKWLAWSLFTFEKHTLSVLKASYPAILASMFDMIYQEMAEHTGESQLARYLLVLCGLSLGMFATYQGGFLPSAQKFFLIYLCQNYVKQYNTMRKVDDHRAITMPVPRYILPPSVATRMLMLVFHFAVGFYRKDHVGLLASLVGFFSSILLVKCMKAWNKELRISQVDPRDSKALLKQSNQLYLLSVCGFYVFGYLPATHLAQKYGLSVSCGKEARLQETILTDAGCTNVNIQPSLLDYLRPSFWWSNTITATSTWVSAEGHRLQQTCLCSQSEATPLVCGPVMNQTQY